MAACTEGRLNSLGQSAQEVAERRGLEGGCDRCIRSIFQPETDVLCKCCCKYMRFLRHIGDERLPRPFREMCEIEGIPCACTVGQKNTSFCRCNLPCKQEQQHGLSDTACTRKNSGFSCGK